MSKECMKRQKNGKQRRGSPVPKGKKSSMQKRPLPTTGRSGIVIYQSAPATRIGMQPWVGPARHGLRRHPPSHDEIS